MKRFLPILCLLLPACIAPDQGGLSKLEKGAWIEAKGRIEDGHAIVDEIDELERSDSDKAEKVEVTAEAKVVSPTELELLGLTFTTDVETEYENEDKGLIEPFVPTPGEWLRLKLRLKDEVYKVRTVRKEQPREQFKVTGEVLDVDHDRSIVDVGGIRLPVKGESSIAVAGERYADDPLALFQADEQKAVPFTLKVNDNLHIGGGVSVGYDVQDEYDLDQATARDRGSLNPQAKIDALWLFDDRASYAMVEAEAGRTDQYRAQRSDTHNEQAQVTRAVMSAAVASGVQLLFGRQDFDEEREWLYDEVLDGVRGVYLQDGFQFELGAAQGRDVLATVNPTDDTYLFTAVATYRPSPDWLLSGYALKRRDDTVRDHEPMLFGLRSIDSPRYGLGHWAELSWARGHSRNTMNNGGLIADDVGDVVEDIHGWAFDVGAMYTFDAGLRPALALSYAYGQGRRDSAQAMGYRQTTYNDNNGKLGGVTSVRYYGELLRPELANLAILTAGLSVRPTSRSSVSLLFHTYTQDFASQSQPFTDLRIGSLSQPNGRDPDLGYEVDLVFGLREFQQTTIELVLGHFEPGAGFDGQDAANKLDFTFRFTF